MNSNLIVKILSDSASDQEKVEFNNWLQESELNTQYFEQMKVLWDITGKVPSFKHFDEEEGKDKIRKKIYQRRTILLKNKTHRIWLSTAASILILAGISVLTFHQADNLFTKRNVYVTQNEKQEYYLPDGSKVWLNANSTLIVPEKFNKNKRKIKLKGEAFFEITHDESRPFEIITGKTITKVLGTSFNIKMDTLYGNVSVIVNSGIVSFSQKNNKKEANILHAGERADFDNASKRINKEMNKNVNYLSWKTGILTFKNTPLKEVCYILSQYYKKNINTKITDPEFVINGSFDNETLDNLLSTVQIVLDVNVVQNKSRIVITR